jgi:hypothetical protein
VLFNQKIQNELARLIGAEPGAGDEKSLQSLFQSAQQAISKGLAPANLRKIDRVLNKIATESGSSGNLTQLFEKLTPGACRSYIKLCDSCNSAIRQFEAKKRSVEDILGIEFADPYLQSEESDALVNKIPKELNLREFKQTINECFFPWMSSFDKVKLLTVLSSLDLADSRKVSHLLGFIFSLGRSDLSDIENYITLIVELPPLDSIKELIRAIFSQERFSEDPLFMKKGLIILSNCKNVF